MVSQFEVLATSSPDGEPGFRPLSGFMVSQSWSHRLHHGLVFRFRPLSGFMVSQYNYARKYIDRALRVSVPCRGLWFLNLPASMGNLSGSSVSVPCRGLWFLNDKMKTEKEKIVVVSVPCRGLWFLNILQDAIVLQNAEFPSPVGVYGFSIRTLWVRLRYHFRVSVPCRGLWFLNLSPDARINFRASFRPLSGFMVSQSSTPSGVEVLATVSVPCRGLWFLNLSK
mgnify:CR=1 FL=1